MTALTDTQLREAFDTTYPGRNWSGDCQAVMVNACDFTGGEEVIYPSATAAMNDSVIVSRAAEKAPRGAFHWFEIPSEPDGHVLLDLSGGGYRCLHGHRLLDEAWGINIGTIDIRRLYEERAAWYYVGWSTTNGRNTVNLVPLTPPPLLPNQRPVGDIPARVRAEASTGSEQIGLLPAGTVVTVTAWREGEPVAGVPIWYAVDELRHGGGWIHATTTWTPYTTDGLLNLTPTPDPDPEEPTVPIPPVVPGIPTPADPTQVEYPGKAMLRTIVQALVVLIPTVNVLAGTIGTYLAEQTDVTIPDWAFLALNAAAVGTSLVIGAVTRIMAIPGVNDWLTKLGLGATPKAADE